MTAPDVCEIEIERDGKRRRVNCLCGFLGPWRFTRRSAVREADDHLDRRAEESR